MTRSDVSRKHGRTVTEGQHRRVRAQCSCRMITCMSLVLLVVALNEGGVKAFTTQKFSLLRRNVLIGPSSRRPSFITAKESENESSPESSKSALPIQGIVEDNGSTRSHDNSVEDPFKVGAVVRPRYLDKTGGAPPPRDDAILPPPSTPLVASSSSSSSSSSSTVDSSSSSSTSEEAQTFAEMQRRNVIVAVASVFLAVSNYAYQFLHPVTPLQLLVDMQEHSAPISVIGKNPKPTVVDFWAPWCENCQRIAPALYQLEEEYRDSVNFVMINGDDPVAWPYVQALGVDAIPHLALVTASGDVETALIGPVPKSILEADLNALVKKSNPRASPQEREEPLPHTMLDVFAGRPPEERRVHFDPE